MGTWDATSFGNDTANDWAYGLRDCNDLSFIEAALQKILNAGDSYITSRDAVKAIAAAEVLAWLRGQPTPVNACTKKAGSWVLAHPIRRKRNHVSTRKTELLALSTAPRFKSSTRELSQAAARRWNGILGSR
jgi:hypothetical protein